MSLSSSNNFLSKIWIPIKKLLSPNNRLNVITDTSILFIHIPKAAGSSIVSSLYKLDRTHGHHQWWFYRSYFGQDLYSRLYKFTVVRNPFDRMVSTFHYLKAGGNNPSDKSFFESRFNQSTTFKEFLITLENEQALMSWIHLVPQYKFIYDDKDHLQVNFVAKLESINDDLLKIAEQSHTKLKLDQKNKSNHEPYSTYYDEESLNIVVKLYNKDFELLGYSKSLTDPA